ncbi:MAG: ORF6N domain-containing protein [Chthoniobacterales bacterium]
MQQSQRCSARIASGKRRRDFPQAVERLILTIRDQKVILDSDLAALYGVTTKRLNEQFRRNRKRFPEDFAFQLTAPELDDLRPLIAIHSKEKSLRSQNATLKLGRGQHRKYRPYAFTEHGALQAANILNSPRAVQMSVFVIRAFVKMRETLLGTRELTNKLQELEKQLTGRLDTHEVAIVRVLQQVMKILNPPPPPPAPRRPKIGFSPGK